MRSTRSSKPLTNSSTYTTTRYRSSGCEQFEHECKLWKKNDKTNPGLLSNQTYFLAVLQSVFETQGVCWPRSTKHKVPSQAWMQSIFKMHEIETVQQLAAKCNLLFGLQTPFVKTEFTAP